MIITIVGIGLIGGSMAISLKESGFASEIIGVDRSQDNLDKAIRRRLIDRDASLEEAVAASDIIIIATPVNAIIHLLPQILDLVDNQLVIDVGSTKEAIIEAVKGHPKRSCFVPSHPMAGTEYSGPEAAIPNLFDYKCSVICDPEHSAKDKLLLTQQLYEAMKMKLIYLDAVAHDVHTAYVSHISHISSFALALTVLEKEKNEKRIFELASAGFSSTVRLAKSSPEMWVPIFKQNRDNVLDVLDEHINSLARFRSLLIKKDFEGFHQMIAQSNSIRKILK
ncbi:MAG: prephenate dehydrogenase [Bacteroidota bacterium]